jgi:hypothetical protein
MRISRTNKATEACYKSLFACFITVFGYIVLRDEIYLPTSLLGNGSLDNLDAQYPYYTGSKMFKIFYLSSMGYHVHFMI